MEFEVEFSLFIEANSSFTEVDYLGYRRVKSSLVSKRKHITNDKTIIFPTALAGTQSCAPTHIGVKYSDNSWTFLPLNRALNLPINISSDCQLCIKPNNLEINTSCKNS